VNGTLLTPIMPGLLLPTSSQGISTVGSCWAKEATASWAQLCEP